MKNERSDLKIYVCTHTDFDCPVKSPVYEIIDARTLNGDKCENGLPGAFYSELLTYRHVASTRGLPEYVGFCGYRKYFSFMDDVPDKDELDRCQCITPKPRRFDCNILEQYARSHYVGDIALVFDIIQEHYPRLAFAFHRMLGRKEMFVANMFIMPSRVFRVMMGVVWDILDRYLAVVGTDIEKRVREHPDWYHAEKRGRYGTVAYQSRIGGYLGERIISAFIMGHYPLNVFTSKYSIIHTEQAR